MDASYKIQRGIHVHLIQFFMCPEFWVHITMVRRFLIICSRVTARATSVRPQTVQFNIAWEATGLPYEITCTNR